MSSDTRTRDRQGRHPAQFSAHDWLQTAKRIKNQIVEDHVPIVSAGIAFYFFLSLFPLLAAVVSVYGLVYDSAQVERQIDQLATLLPESAHVMVGNVANSMAQSPDQALGWGVIVSLLISFWSANKGSKAIYNGLNIAYDQENGRNFWRKIGVTLALTFAGIIMLILALVLVAGVPALAGMLPLPSPAIEAVAWLRWPMLTVLVMGGLAVLYKLVPERERPKWRWVSVGSVVATLLWLGASALFSLYVDQLGNFEQTYGSFAAVVLLMLWFYLTAFAILLGAEVNSELERQTAALRPDSSRRESEGSSA